MTTNNNHKVVIIGAGVSGLAAAQELISQNIEPIVLEARDRIGGRVYTNTDHFGFPIDFGASFIHGIGDNIIYDMVKKHEIEVLVHDDNPSIYDCCTGEQIDQDLCSTEYDRMKHFVNHCLREQFTSMETDICFKSALKQVMDNERLVIEDPIRKRVWQCFVNDMFGGYNSAEINEIGSKYFFQHSESMDDVYSTEDVIFPNGYSQIIEHMAKNVDIRMNHVVSRIDYTESDVVVLTLLDGRQFQCNKVIITVPLGILKQELIEFTPSLPLNKLDAIRSLGFGLMTKMILEFESAVAWDEKVPCFSLLPTPDEDVNPFYVVNWKRYTGRNVLLVFITGSIAKKMHQQSDEQSIQQVIQSLRVLNPSEFPDLIRAKVLNWGNDPFSLGSYSYVSVGTNSDTFENLAESVNGVLYFAGEATSATDFGYVHGAYHTGIREARNLLSSS